MLRPILFALAASCLCLVSACVDLLKISPEFETKVREAYDLVRANNVEGFHAIATPALQEVTAEQIAEIAALIPESEPDSTRVVGNNQTYHYGDPTYASTHAMTYEYHWPDRVALVSATYVKTTENSPPQLDGFHVQIATREELKANDFALTGKTTGHYMVLAAMLASAVAMVLAFVMSIQTPGLRRRWLWCLASLATVCQFNLNWANGAFQWVLLHGGLINLGASRGDSLFAVWVVTTGIPLGAIIVIVRLWGRWRTRREKAANPTTPA
jgi:hypothetical protein